VQQDNGSVAPMIQRRLLVTGSKKDISAALYLLEPASGFTLQHDPKTHEVTITASKLKPQSFVLAGQLATIMSDPKQDAKIHLGQDQPGVSFGAFPGSSQALDDNPVQEIRIDQMMALERDLPGAGVAKMAHEIVENYAGHDPQVKENAWQFAFGEAHSRALDVENAIESELGHPGARRNSFSVSINPGKGKPPFYREIEDRGTHFLVLDKSRDKGIVSNARRVPRVRVASYTINGFMANSNTLPKTAAADLAAIVKDLKKNPTTSAFVEGFASLGKTADENARLADKWAFEVRDQVILLAKDQTGVSWHRFETIGQPDKSRNSVVVTIDRPDI
jgi:outer membrane protein OmpA-like peptidoglycan-associated protein